MSECRHMGQSRLDTAAWCAVERKAIVTCLECGEVIPKGHFRKMLRELKDRTGMEIRPPRPEINPSGGPHWDLLWVLVFDKCSTNDRTPPVVLGFSLFFPPIDARQCAPVRARVRASARPA